MNTLNATHARLLRLLSGKRSVSYDELSALLPESVNEQEFEEILAFLSTRGIAVTEDPFVGAAAADAACDEELEPDEGAQEELERRKLDDPIRMYFSQMATIPLLSREEEVSLAKEIEDSRTRLRDLVYQTRLGHVRAVELLELVREKEVLIEKALDINLNQKGERHRFLEVLKQMHCDLLVALIPGSSYDIPSPISSEGFQYFDRIKTRVSMRESYNFFDFRYCCPDTLGGTQSWWRRSKKEMLPQ